MRAGLLNRQISIYRPTVTINEYGEREEQYTKMHTVRARMIRNGGSRTTENSEIVIPYSYIFEMYRHVDVRETDYIQYKEKKYRILSIDDQWETQKKSVQVELINE